MIQHGSAFCRCHAVRQFTEVEHAPIANLPKLLRLPARDKPTSVFRRASTRSATAQYAQQCCHIVVVVLRCSFTMSLLDRCKEMRGSRSGVFASCEMCVRFAFALVSSTAKSFFFFGRQTRSALSPYLSSRSLDDKLFVPPEAALVMRTILSHCLFAGWEKPG